MKALDGMLGRLHGGRIHPRRVRVLAGHLARLLPDGAHVLDVGSGDGRLAATVAEMRTDVQIEGIDTLVRDWTAIPVTPFDGAVLPFTAASFDAVVFIDVLHHTLDPMVLLREAVRVTRQSVVIKDHLCQGFLAASTLAFMDRVANVRHGVAVPANYWTPAKWRAALATLGLDGQWETRLGLYPWPGSVFFERSLHFLGRFDLY